MTLLWICSTNSSTTFGTWNIFCSCRNTPVLTKQAEFKAVGVPAILRTFKELQLHQRHCLITGNWWETANICVSFQPVRDYAAACHSWARVPRVADPCETYCSGPFKISCVMEQKQTFWAEGYFEDIWARLLLLDNSLCFRRRPWRQVQAKNSKPSSWGQNELLTCFVLFFPASMRMHTKVFYCSYISWCHYLVCGVTGANLML